MSEYRYKYLKYKTKYKNLCQIGGMAHYILLDGTSSSGKTSICDFYEEKEYVRISIDDFLDKKFNKIFSELPNEYTNIMKIIAKDMVDEAEKHDKVIFDVVDQNIIEQAKTVNGKNIYVIVVYASLEDLIRNIDSRRKKMDPRGIFVFDQFVERYTKTDEKTDMIVNRKKFIKKLEETMKYEFNNEEDLEKYAINLFKRMDIDDDDDYYVELRENYYADYIINTSGKSKREIYEELKNKTESYDDD